MPKIIIDPDRCKGCEICVSVCPGKVIAMDEDALNAKGYHPAEPVRPEDCTGCAVCALMCPDVAIQVLK